MSSPCTLYARSAGKLWQPQLGCRCQKVMSVCMANCIWNCHYWDILWYYTTFSWHFYSKQLIFSAKNQEDTNSRNSQKLRHISQTSRDVCVSNISSIRLVKRQQIESVVYNMHYCGSRSHEAKLQSGVNWFTEKRGGYPGRTPVEPQWWVDKGLTQTLKIIEPGFIYTQLLTFFI